MAAESRCFNFHHVHAFLTPVLTQVWIK